MRSAYRGREERGVAVHGGDRRGSMKINKVFINLLGNIVFSSVE